MAANESFLKHIELLLQVINYFIQEPDRQIFEKLKTYFIKYEILKKLNILSLLHFLT